MGSAGAKAMAVLRGDADAYVHAGGQWEWDSAAPVGVVLAAGLHASRLDGSPLVYNEAHPYLPDLLICSPRSPTGTSPPSPTSDRNPAPTGTGFLPRIRRGRLVADTTVSRAVVTDHRGEETMQLKPGTRLQSTTCDTQVIAVRVPAGRSRPPLRWAADGAPSATPPTAPSRPPGSTAAP